MNYIKKEEPLLGKSFHITPVTINTTVQVAGTVGGMLVSAGGATAAGGLSGGAKALLRGGVNYALTQNPVAKSFASSMNLFSGNGQSKGLMQKGGLSQALGLTAPGNRGGLVDRFKADSDDKKKDSKDGNTDNKNQQNQQNTNPSIVKGKDGEKTIEKQNDKEKETSKETSKEVTKEGTPSDGKNAPAPNNTPKNPPDSANNNPSSGESTNAFHSNNPSGVSTGNTTTASPHPTPAPAMDAQAQQASSQTKTVHTTETSDSSKPNKTTPKK